MHIEVKASDLQKIKLFVATPMYGGQCAGMYSKAAIDLATMCANYGVECRFFFIFNESLITRARNYLVDEFLRAEEFTHMMFIDSDINFNPKDDLSLAVLSQQEDKPIIGGPYGKKCFAKIAGKIVFTKNNFWNFSIDKSFNFYSGKVN